MTKHNKRTFSRHLIRSLFLFFTLCYFINSPIICAEKNNEKKTLRKWTWHGGKYWKPNKIDNTYRIENSFNGQAIIITPGQVVTQQFQGPVPGYQQRIKFEPVNQLQGEYRLYTQNGSEKCYLTAMPELKSLKMIEMQEIKVFNQKGENLISESTKATQSSTYYNNPAYGPDKAIDNNNNTFSNTNQEVHPYLDLDLGKDISDISKITISIRGFVSGRLNGASVIIKNNAEKEVWRGTLKIPSSLYTVKLDKPVTGRYIRIEHDTRNDNSIYVHGTKKPNGNNSIWQISLVSPTGYYTLLNKGAGKVLQLPKHMGVDILAEAMHPVKLADYKPGDLTMSWSVEPVCDFAIDFLAVSEIGWVPEAPQKWAYLIRKNKLDTPPAWKVSDQESGKEILSGNSIYAGYMYKLHYYLINLTPLKKTGDFLLECNGDGADVHIADDAYVNFRHRGGSDVTHLSDMIDGKGFVGYWAHNDNWDHVECLTQPYFVIRDFKTNKDTITKEKITAKYLGGWDHTDRWSSAIQPISEVLRQLVFTYDLCKDDVLKKHLINEMLYGIKYLLNIQNHDGSWPFATFCANKTTGTTAAVAGALAQSYQIIKNTDKKMAEKVLKSATSGWEWVKGHPNDWVESNITYRHGWSEDEMILALELYFLTNSEECKDKAFSMIKDAKIEQKTGAWIKKEGKFNGQSINNRSTQLALISMMRHYSQLPEDIQTSVMSLWQQYYDILMQWNKEHHGPFHHWEIQTGGYGPNSRWVRNSNFLYRIYTINPEKYQKGFYVAEHVMDWIFGVNPFATSLVYGFGDRFLSESWVRPYIKGSILPGLAVYLPDGKWVNPVELTPSLQAYGNGESETSLGVVLMQCLIQRENLRNIYPSAGPLPAGPVLKQ